MPEMLFDQRNQLILPHKVVLSCLGIAEIHQAVRLNLRDEFKLSFLDKA